MDLDSAAAIENDETMIINSDLSIITTPIESPLTDITDSINRSPRKHLSKTQTESDGTITSDTSSSEVVAVVIEKNKRHRPKARSESNRSQKYAKKFYSFVSVFDFLILVQLGVHSYSVRLLVFQSLIVIMRECFVNFLVEYFHPSILTIA